MSPGAAGRPWPRRPARARLAPALLLGALLAAGCRRPAPTARPEDAPPTQGATAVPAASSTAPLGPDRRDGETPSPEVLIARPTDRPTVWFDPLLEGYPRLFDAGGTLFLPRETRLYRLDGDRAVEVPVRFVDRGSPRVAPSRFTTVDPRPNHPYIAQVFGHHPGHLWLVRYDNTARRLPSPTFYRQRDDGLFAEFDRGSSMHREVPYEWDGDRLLLPAMADAPLRWVDAADRESPATFAGLPPGCSPLAQAHSRGWVVARVSCDPDRHDLDETWLFDPATRGRRIEGLGKRFARHLLVRADGGTWLVIGDIHGHGELCHLRGDELACQELPRDLGALFGLGERGDDLLLLASEGVWSLRGATLTLEPIHGPDGGRVPRVEWSLLDARGQLWGAAEETDAAGRRLGFRIFRHTL